MNKRWGVALVVALVLVAGGVLVVVAMGGSASSPGAPVPSRPASGRQVLISARGVQVSDEAGEALLAALSVDVKRPGRFVVDVAQRAILSERLETMIRSGEATVVSEPRLMVLDGQGASVEISSEQRADVGLVLSREVFVVDVTALIVEGGVSLQTAVSRTTADGPVGVALQDLGLDRGSRAQSTGTIGREEAMVVWLDGVLVEIMATPVP